MNAEIRNAKGERLDYTFHDAPGGNSSVVVIGHGVTANKDRPFVEALAMGMATVGVPALRFSFAGNGASEGSFEECCITKEVGDLGAVLDALPGKQVIYVGHSMGDHVFDAFECPDALPAMVSKATSWVMPLALAPASGT